MMIPGAIIPSPCLTVPHQVSSPSRLPLTLPLALFFLLVGPNFTCLLSLALCIQTSALLYTPYITAISGDIAKCLGEPYQSIPTLGMSQAPTRLPVHTASPTNLKENSWQHNSFHQSAISPNRLPSGYKLLIDLSSKQTNRQMEKTNRDESKWSDHETKRIWYQISTSPQKEKKNQILSMCWWTRVQSTGPERNSPWGLGLPVRSGTEDSKRPSTWKEWTETRRRSPLHAKWGP